MRSRMRDPRRRGLLGARRPEPAVRRRDARGARQRDRDRARARAARDPAGGREAPGGAAEAGLVAAARSGPRDPLCAHARAVRSGTGLDRGRWCRPGMRRLEALVAPARRQPPSGQPSPSSSVRFGGTRTVPMVSLERDSCATSSSISSSSAAIERLLLEQRCRQPVETGAMLARRRWPPRRRVGETSLLAVAQPLRLLGQRVVVGAHRARRRHVGHAVLEHHGAGESVAFSRSLAAPFVTRPNTTCSAARPASATFIRSSSSSFVCR